MKSLALFHQINNMILKIKDNETLRGALPLDHSCLAKNENRRIC